MTAPTSVNGSEVRSTDRGFTLIELMIAVAVVAILAAVALPSYRSYLVRTHRAAAASCLMEMGQHMERYYATQMSYADATVPDLNCVGEVPEYDFDFEGTPSATAFQVKATPNGGQANDTACGTLKLDQAGAKQVTGSDTVANCWR